MIFQHPGVLPFQFLLRGVSVDVLIDIGAAMEHEQAAETAHHFTSLLIFAKRLDRTDMQSGAVCRVKAALQEKIEMNR